MTDGSGKSGNKNTLWAGAAGALDPWLVNLAQKLAAGVSEDSPLRSVAVGTIAGIVKGIIESKSDTLPVPLRVTIEKATDFGDFFAGALGAARLPAKKWGDKFLEDARDRLRMAADPRAELEKIKLELELVRELATLLESEAEKTTKPTATDGAETTAGVSDPAVGEALASEIQRLNEKLETLRGRAKAWARKESAK